MKQESVLTNALLNLLEDDDRYVSTVAMEQLLSSDNVDELVAEFQESHSPILRNRVHQIGNILRGRQLRSEFVKNFKNAAISLWDGIVQINFHYNPKMDSRQLARMMISLEDQLPRRLSAASLAEFMRSKNFSFSGEDIIGPDLYLIEDVLLHQVGSPILLSVVARELGRKRDLETSVALYKGKHCLIDRFNNLIKPTEDWRIKHLKTVQDIRVFGKANIWLVVLSQLFVSAMLEGRLQAIHRVGSLLAELCGGRVRNFPFPLGS